MSKVAAPLNFIPGTTQPVVIRNSPELPKRKYEAQHCYHGVPLRLTPDSSENDKAILSVGLAALSLAAPSGHKNCNHIDISTRTQLSKSLPCVNKINKAKSGDTTPNDNKEAKKKILPSKLAKKAKRDLGSKRWHSLEKLHNYAL